MPEAFVEGTVSEEQLMEEEEIEEQVAKTDEEQEGEEVLKKGGEAAKIHQWLGHPTKATLVRMLTLAGASKETLRLAADYKCPVCQAQTDIFGKEVHLHLKYMQDKSGRIHIYI